MASGRSRGKSSRRASPQARLPAVEVHRGEVWWASLTDPAGSAPGFRRPILIVQSDEFNASRIGTVIAVAITSNTRLAEAPGNVLLPARNSRLHKKSVANVSQVITLDRRFLSEKVGRLDPRLLARVDDGLRLALSL